MVLKNAQKICLVTTGQPSTNPRLVKEADALSEAGYDVAVICAHWANWADKTDEALLASKIWGKSVTYVGGKLNSSELKHLWTRARHGLTRRVSEVIGDRVPNEWIISRVTPELTAAACQTKADLYIAHNLGALPAAVHAAKRNDAKVGFDAEDFHSGMSANPDDDRLARSVEAEFIASCDYLTAASPGIARAYAETYQVETPATVLNVFPLAERPEKFREQKQDQPLRLYWFSQSIGPERGIEDVVAAMGQLLSGRVELHLRGQWMGQYQNELLTFAASQNVDAARIVWHEPAEPNQMARLASQFDIGLAPELPTCRNRQICISNKLFTYMLAGNAVVATNTEGQFEILSRTPGIGFSYEPGDVGSLAKQLEIWCDDRKSLNDARVASWEAGTHQYNWDIEKHKFLNVVENVLQPPAQTSRHVA